MKKYVILLLLLLFPFVVNAETCDANSITIKSVESVSTTGNASEKNKSKVSNKNIELELSMNHVEDSITYKVVIENKSKDDYEINNKFNSKSNYIEYSFVNNDSNIIKAKSTKEVLVKAEYKNEVPATMFSNSVFNEKEDIILSLSTLTNPKTGFIIPTILVIIGIVGFICYLIINKEFKSSTLVIIVGLLLIIPIGTYANCKIDINVKSKVEVSKIAMLDTGATVNDKLRTLISDDNSFHLYTFARSNSLPDNIKTLATNQINESKNITVSDEEINDKLELIDSYGLLYNYHVKIEDGVEYTCYSYSEDSPEYCDFSYLHTNKYKVKLINSGETKYRLYDYVNDKTVYYNEVEIKNVIKNDIYKSKKNEIEKNIFLLILLII